jgi:polysaccharide pyruvyl transferase WcaK-like protein
MTMSFSGLPLLYVTAPLLGNADISLRIREALWDTGYPVVAVDPADYGFSFDDEQFWAKHLPRLVARYQVGTVLISGRYTYSNTGTPVPQRPVVQATTALRAQGIQVRIVEDGWRCDAPILETAVFDEVICISHARRELLEARGISCQLLVYRPSQRYQTSSVAEEATPRDVILCVQDAAPGRPEYLAELLQQRQQERLTAGLPLDDLRIECYGHNWPTEWARGGYGNEFVFSAHNARELVVFDSTPDEDTLFISRATLPLAAGAALHPAPSLSAIAQARLERDLSEAPLLDAQVSILAGGNDESSVAAEKPRYALILGYFGWNNFGDELILEILAKRVQKEHPGCLPVAVCEKPTEVFARHGIMAVALSDRAQLAAYMEQAAVLLVCAGLLFDVGIYYTKGRRSLLDAPAATDLPGLAGACVLAQLYDLPVLFYGAGAGPLVNTESKALVRFMGQLGARFLMRDDASADCIREAGVDDEQVSCIVDLAYGLEQPSPQPAAAWGAAHGISFAAQRVIVVSLRDWTDASSHDFACRIAGALDRIVTAHTDLRVVFISFDPADIALHAEVYGYMQHKAEAVLYGLAENIDEVLSVLASSYAGIAMRLHCSILMNRFGRPTIGLNYLDKVEAQYRNIEQGGLLMPLDASSDRLAEAFAELDASYGARSAHIIERTSELASRLMSAGKLLDTCLDTPRALAYPTDCYLRSI